MTLHTISQNLFEPPLWLALLLALAFAGLAWQAHLLTRGGALATFLVGFVVFGLGGGKFVVPLLTFFLSSSLLSRLASARKAAVHAYAAKGSTRDAGQVWANGGVATALALVFRSVVYHWPWFETHTLLMLFLAALATVNADTWATEIGGLSRSAPRLLSNWRPAEPGTSGAITGLGLVAALAGSVAIALSAFWLWPMDGADFVAVAWAGFLGSLIDSILGAGIQAQYRDTKTGQLTERAQIAGRKTVRVRGLAWMNNDVVNFLASVGGVLCAWAMLHYSVRP